VLVVEWAIHGADCAAFLQGNTPMHARKASRNMANVSIL
jgi:hypothetical protein